MHNDLHTLFAAIDQAFKTVSQVHPEAINCQKGCADCCQAVFDVSLVEAANLLAQVQQQAPGVQERIVGAAREARQGWEQMIASHLDPGMARIRCPLLDDAGCCLCYEARPVNCRTYGIPTEIDGKGHVCGLSRFEPGKSYPTVKLAPLQRILRDLSVHLAGEEMGAGRWPIAAVILEQQVFKVFVASFTPAAEK
ncbi:YkgJ family cysteine cluster protein [Thiovibrio frasassiensis]|uniref:YkgJ family cysteine cluster protein n=1 Tax=Thiovibrio frasassiensis TaxID=2984131 RepID=A0A9X4MH74_9BACT|nr:YkgJ family cysteine cluster protein [Thiovibrio frasassiensis]MDG4474769.1 YkgJ family cysteine cluster protein [Thiovibrio frasassiensis]